MISAVSPGYQKAVNFLHQLGIVDPDDDDSSRAQRLACCDTALATRAIRGGYDLLLTDSDSQHHKFYDLSIRSFGSTDDLLLIVSPLIETKNGELKRGWTIETATGIGNYPSLRRFLLTYWSEILTSKDPSSLIPEAERFDPESAKMLLFIRHLFTWFRQQSS